MSPGKNGWLKSTMIGCDSDIDEEDIDEEDMNEEQASSDAGAVDGSGRH
jgi:hypothetical protein